MQQVSVLETNIGSSTTGNSADTQVIFNDAGTLRGDAGLTYNKTTDTLSTGSATITGDLTVDTSTLKVDSTNNYVGIGTASPAQKLHLENQANSCFIRTGSTQNASGFDFGVGGTGDSTAYIYNRNNTPIVFGTNATEKMRLDSSGNLSLASGNLVMSTAGKGIDFSATTSGSGTMTSELLNDYEEGTWTGTLKGSVSDPTVALAATGNYTKIGRVVHVRINFSGSTAGASGIVSITGLPFSSSQESPGALMAGSALTFTGFAVSYVTAGSGTIE